MSYCRDLLLVYDFDRAAFAAAARDVRTLIRHSEIEVVGSSGRPNSLPVVEELHITFNRIARHPPGKGRSGAHSKGIMAEA